METFSDRFLCSTPFKDEFEVSSPHAHVVFYHPSSEEMGKGIFQDVKSESQYTFASL